MKCVYNYCIQRCDIYVPIYSVNLQQSIPIDINLSIYCYWKSIPIDNHMNLRHRLVIDYQYPSINWYRLVLIDIDCPQLSIRHPGIRGPNSWAWLINSPNFFFCFRPCHLPISWSWILSASRSRKRSSSCKEATKTSAQRGVVNTLIPPPLPRYILRHGAVMEARLNHRNAQDISAIPARQQRYIFSLIHPNYWKLFTRWSVCPWYTLYYSVLASFIVSWTIKRHYNKSYMHSILTLNQLFSKYRTLLSEQFVRKRSRNESGLQRDKKNRSEMRTCVAYESTCNI